MGTSQTSAVTPAPGEGACVVRAVLRMYDIRSTPRKNNPCPAEKTEKMRTGPGLLRGAAEPVLIRYILANLIWKNQNLGSERKENLAALTSARPSLDMMGDLVPTFCAFNITQESSKYLLDFAVVEPSLPPRQFRHSREELKVLSL